eukprot:scaffold48514_cov55-Attheya_sp.AAC.5
MGRRPLTGTSSAGKPFKGLKAIRSWLGSIAQLLVHSVHLIISTDIPKRAFRRALPAGEQLLLVLSSEYWMMLAK